MQERCSGNGRPGKKEWRDADAGGEIAIDGASKQAKREREKCDSVRDQDKGEGATLIGLHPCTSAKPYSRSRKATFSSRLRYWLYSNSLYIRPFLRLVSYSCKNLVSHSDCCRSESLFYICNNNGNAFRIFSNEAPAPPLPIHPLENVCLSAL